MEQQPVTKNIQKVTTGNVKKKKKNEITKLTEVFVSEDVHKVKDYIFMDVLVPAFKKALSDVVTNGIEMLLYGEPRGKNNRGSSSRVSYRSYYDDKDRDRRYTSENRRAAGYSFDDIILDSRGEAEEVLMKMDEIIDTYNIVSVADYYELVGVTGNYTDNKYGWSNLRTAAVVRVRDGYMIRLPKATPL